MNTVKKLPYDPGAQDSAIRRLSCERGATLSDVIKALDWGNHKRIRTGGFRIADQISKLSFNPAVKDPFLSV